MGPIAALKYTNSQDIPTTAMCRPATVTAVKRSFRVCIYVLHITSSVVLYTVSPVNIRESLVTRGIKTQCYSFTLCKIR